MRTLQIVNVRWYNATAWYGVTLARTLNAAGHRSRVVGLAETEPLRQARRMGMECEELPLNDMAPHRLPALVRGMEDLLRRFRPDVVNCHRGESFVLGALLKRRFWLLLLPVELVLFVALAVWRLGKAPSLALLLLVQGLWLCLLLYLLLLVVYFLVWGIRYFQRHTRPPQ